MDELLFMCLLICVILYILYVFVGNIGNILYVFVGDDGRLQYILSLPMSECINRVLSCEEKARLFFLSR